MSRLPHPIRRWLHAGGSRQDRLRDPDAVVAALRVRPGDRVADLGPGYGHFTLRLARAVAPDGVLYAADIDPGGLEQLRLAAEKRAILNVVPVPIGRDRLVLPEPVDLLFVSATYHHIRHRVRYFSDVVPLLRAGGRVAILESRAEGVLARWVAHHGTPSGRLRDEMRRAGFELVTTHDLVSGHWFGEFRAAAQLG